MPHAKTRNYILILILIFILISSACAIMTKHLEPPTIEIAEIKIKKLKPLEAIFNVQLRVLNPNDLSIIVKGLSCDLEINNVHLATGVSNTTTQIPALGTTTLSLEVNSSILDLTKSIITLSDNEISKYKIKGRVLLDGGPFIPSDIPFESEGDLNLKELMANHRLNS
jgi:LEA14-like dessication related protein